MNPVNCPSPECWGVADWLEHSAEHSGGGWREYDLIVCAECATEYRIVQEPLPALEPGELW